jgi:hypothetical protein
VQVTFPALDRPEFVDWVDYERRRHSVDPKAFAQRVLDRAGPDSTIWYVLAVQYRGGNEGRCEAVLRSLSAARPGRQLVQANDKFPEFMSLFEFPHR